MDTHSAFKPPRPPTCRASSSVISPPFRSGMTELGRRLNALYEAYL